MNLDAALTDKWNALEAIQRCDEVYKGNVTISSDSAHVLITQTANCIELTCRGSQSAEDWLHDAEVELVDTPYGKIHKGFWSSWASVTLQVDEAFRNMSRVLPVVPIGHSLGAIQACLAALTTVSPMGLTIPFVITFGCPAGGDSEWQRQYNSMLGSKTVRWVDAMDIVPRVPPSVMGYCQIGHEAFLPSKGGVVYDPTKWELDVYDVQDAITDLKAGERDILDDHLLERYRERITELS